VGGFRIPWRITGVLDDSEEYVSRAIGGIGGYYDRYGTELHIMAGLLQQSDVIRRFYTM
jgi:hypothetical protein